MIAFVFKKFISMALSLFFVVTLTFFFMKAIPGNPLLKDMSIPKEITDSLMVQYGFKKPITEQYFSYLWQFLSGDFGKSLVHEGRSVKYIIKEGFPVSLLLGIQSLAVAISIGIGAGAFAAVKNKKWQDHCFTLVYSLGISMPSFLIATLLQYFFSMKLNLFPTANFDTFNHTILPTISLALLPTVFIAKLTRDNMVEMLQKPFVKFALSKGISPRRLLFSHILRNSLLPIVGYVGPMSVSVITGSFVVEKIFGIPGLGTWLISSILSRDYPVIMGLTIFISTFLLLVIFIVDIMYYIIDPRLKLKKEYD
jgi:oligopeptide transport system permease protein